MLAQWRLLPMLELSLIVWLVCSLPVAMLIGYCTLSEELQAHGPRRSAVPPSQVPIAVLARETAPTPA